MNKIKVEDILKKHHSGATYAGLENVYREQEVKAAIKELIDTAVDKCAEEVKQVPICGENYEDCNVPYCETCTLLVDQESILQVKEIFDYE